MIWRPEPVALLMGMLLSFPAFAPAAQEFPAFPDVAVESGLGFRNLSGGGEKNYIVESVGSGAGWFDYDRDGDVDLILTNGSTLERYAAGGDPKVALYRNDGGRFADVTTEAGLSAAGWGMGLCAADIDNDGDTDVYVTAYGTNTLYVNNGNGTFSDRSEASGTADARWGTNCAFGDYDRDGDVDLYVANYVGFSLEAVPDRGTAEICKFMSVDVFCGPRGLSAEPDILYRNDGQGAFTDVTGESGVDAPGRYGFGVLFSDLDSDGWLDIYVANDSVPNFLYRNNRDGTFTEVGFLSGTALSERGLQQAGMGVAGGDYDGNGLLDIAVTNFSDDTNTLYRNLGDLLFIDATTSAGLGRVSFPYLGWGTGLVDLDNDGRLDLFVSNGHIYPQIDDAGGASRYLQRKELYRNLGDGRFEELALRLGGDLAEPKSARGTAFGDYDNDGDLDIAVVNLDDVASLYRNDGSNVYHWTTIRLEETSGNRDAIGSFVEIETAAGTQVAEVRSGGSYLSHDDVRLHFGLGTQTEIAKIRVRWSRGGVEEFESLPVDRFLTIREGQGLVPPAAGADAN